MSLRYRGIPMVVFSAALVVASQIPFLLTPRVASGKMSVVNSRHNLSRSGASQGGTTFSEETRICVFCHVPHNAAASDPLWSPYPLWSRSVTDLSRFNNPYASSTIHSYPRPDKPTGSSRLCLSCHDGTIALGDFAGSKITTQVFMPTGATAATSPRLGTDLRDDHPISFSYTNALALQSNLALPATLPPQVKLEQGEFLQCTSCHDPHDNEFGNFLVMDNAAPGSPLCVACHNQPGWKNSSHNPANTTSMAAGCMNCHYSHNAPKPQRLLSAEKEEDTCISTCHATIAPLFNLPHRHPVEASSTAHDEAESLPVQQYHAECVDCHNPHQANNRSASPAIDGRLAGVRIDNLGTVAANEYEICFKCHGGQYAAAFCGVRETPSNRVVAEPDQKKRFDGVNPSFHPVMAQRRSNGASLLSTLQLTMLRIACSDCHNSDQGTKAGGSGPNGPHGSNYDHILAARYEMPAVSSSPPPYSQDKYALCFRCHAETYIMGSSSGFENQGVNEHSAHVQSRGIPCYACHDPHGISLLSATSGTTQNYTHLINLNKDYAAGTSVPNPVYTATATSGAGNCTVTCHSVGGTNHAYSPTGVSGKTLFKRK